MALVVKDRVKETTSTTGTGTLTLAGAVAKFQSFSVVGDGNTTYYAIESGNGSDWEVGVGTYTASGTTLSRDTILESSNAGSAINLSGTSTVFCTYPAERSVNTADIGTTIQAYDADTAKYDDTTANFTGTLQNGGSNVVVDTDIGSTVQAYDADTTKNDVANTFTANQTINADLTVDTDTLYVDSTNNKVGIGVSSPSEKLHVNGNIALDGSTSGTATFSVPAVAGTTTLTLPTTSGTLLTNNSTGYRFVERVYFTSSGTFSKASYPYLRAMRVMCVGGGGGSGGCAATTSGEFVASGGGGGGGYAESFITNISGLASSVTITVGNGGTGGAAGANNGNAGGNSSFGSTVIGNGGDGSLGRSAQSFWITSTPGNGGSGTGDLVIDGGDGQSGNPVNTNGGYGGMGGTSVLSKETKTSLAWQSSSAGSNGNLYGGGATGGTSGQNFSAIAGGNGAAGIIILELFA